MTVGAAPRASAAALTAVLGLLAGGLGAQALPRPPEAAEGSAQEDERPALELLLEPPYHLRADGSALTARLPFRWGADLAGKEVVLVPAYVRFGEEDLQALAQGATASFEVPSERAPGWLTITIETEALTAGRRSGSYSVAVWGFERTAVVPPAEPDPEPAADSAPAGPLFRQTIELTRSPSTLAGVAAFTIEHRRLLSYRSAARPSAPLRLRAGTGPRPAALQIFQDGAARAGAREVGGRLRVADVGSLDRAGTAVVVEIAEPFPLGESTGNLRIVSPDLEDVEVGFTVVTRQPKFMVGVLALAGLLAGFVVRVVLETYIEKRRALLQVERLERRVERAAARFDEATFNQAIHGLRQRLVELAAALGQTASKEEVTTRIATLDGIQTDLDRALEEVEARRTALKTQLDELTPIFTAPWAVAEPIASAVATGRERYAETDGLLRRGRLATAEERLAGFPAQLVSGLRTGLPDWRRGLGQQLDRVFAVSPPLPAAVVAAAQTAREELKKGLGRALPAPTAAAREQIEALLGAAHEEFEKAANLLRELIDATASELRTAHEALAAERVHLDAAQQNLVAEVEPAVAALEALDPRRLLAAPGGSIDPLTAALDAALKAADGAIRSLDPGGKLDPLLAAGRYREAAEQAAASVAPGGTALGTAPAPLPAAAESWVLAGAHLALPAVLHVRREVELPEHLAIDPVRTAGEILRARLAQTAIVAVGLVFVAVLIFADSFVGTLADWGKVFFWGFTTDVGVNTLVEKARAQVPN